LNRSGLLITLSQIDGSRLSFPVGTQAQQAAVEKSQHPRLAAAARSDKQALQLPALANRCSFAPATASTSPNRMVNSVVSALITPSARRREIGSLIWPDRGRTWGLTIRRRAALDRSRADDPHADRRLLLRHSESAALRQNGFQVASCVNFR
jgi:hypothetical protein